MLRRVSCAVAAACLVFVRIAAETGMCLVASRSGGDYEDYIEGDIRRIDLRDNVVVNTSAPLGYGCWPRFSPDGEQFAYMDSNTVRICAVTGGEVRSFVAADHGNISWTNSGIWVSGNGRITKYSTTGTQLQRYTSGVVQRNYVSANEITGSGVSEGDWHPVIYNMRRNASVRPSAPPGAWTAGCSACPSPNGLMITNNLVENTVQPSDPAEVHRSMRILDTLGNMVMYLRLENITKFTASNYRWDTQCWSGTSNDWICIPVGQGSYVADQNVSACIYNIRTQEKFCLRDNSGTNNYWQPYDYYSGKIPGLSPSLQLSPAALEFAADSGATDPASQTITASTAAGTLEGVSVSGQPAWLTVTPSAASGASIRITNAAHIAGLRVGVYHDTVTVSSSNAGSRTYTVALTVRQPPVQQVLTSLDVTPGVFTVATGASVTFLAAARNQSGAIMRGVSVSWTASGGGSISASGTYTAGAAVGGAYRIVATATAGSVTLRDTAWVDISTRGVTHRRIDCGGNTPSVAAWERDDSFVSGGSDWLNPSSVTVSGVPGAAPEEIYRTVHMGSPHTYTVSGLPPGRYTVRMHWADAYDSTAYQRSMSYTVQGVNVLNGFSIVRLAGGANRALVMDLPADLRSGGDLTVRCEGSGGSDVFEGGMEVLENRSTPITLLAPDGGETYRVGQTVAVRWYADTAKVSQVFVEFSPDDGEGWAIVSGNQGISATRDPAQWGNFQWTIPPAVTFSSGGSAATVSVSCRMRVRPYFLDAGVSPVQSYGLFTVGGSAVGATAACASGLERLRVVWRPGGRRVVDASSAGGYVLRVVALDGTVVSSARCRGVQSMAIAGPGVYAVRMELDGGEVRQTMAVCP